MALLKFFENFSKNFKNLNIKISLSTINLKNMLKRKANNHSYLLEKNCHLTQDDKNFKFHM